MSEKSFKIAVYNIQSCEGWPERIINPRFSADVIMEENPDFIGLNEVSSGEKYGEQPKGVAELAGYNYYYYAPILSLPERLYGNALMSHYPIKNAQMIQIEDPLVQDEDEYYETRCILKSELDILGGITVLVSHFGLAKSERRNAVKKVIELIGKNPKKLILMGDFNMKPDDEILLPLKEHLVDTAVGLDEKTLWSWPSDKPLRKIDYIFTSPDFKVKKLAVSDKIGSDHKMLTAELALEV